MIVPFRQPDPAPVHAVPAEPQRLSLTDARRIARHPDAMWPAFLVDEAQTVLRQANRDGSTPPAPFIHIEDPAPVPRTVAIQTPPLQTAQGRAASHSASARHSASVRKALHQTATFLAGLALGLFLSTLLLGAARGAAADAATARDIAALILSGY